MPRRYNNNNYNRQSNQNSGGNQRGGGGSIFGGGQQQSGGNQSSFLGRSANQGGHNNNYNNSNNNYNNNRNNQRGGRGGRGRRGGRGGKRGGRGGRGGYHGNSSKGNLPKLHIYRQCKRSSSIVVNQGRSKGKHNNNNNHNSNNNNTEDGVRSIAISAQTKQIFTGTHRGELIVFDENGNQQGKFNLGGEVGFILAKHGWLLCGIKVRQPSDNKEMGSILAFNLSKMSSPPITVKYNQQFPYCHTGHIFALELSSSGFLFSGGGSPQDPNMDKDIRLWMYKEDLTSGSFTWCVDLKGNNAGIKKLLLDETSNLLFAGAFDGNMTIYNTQPLAQKSAPIPLAQVPVYSGSQPGSMLMDFGLYTVQTGLFCITANYEGIIKVWQVDMNTIKQIQQQQTQNPQTTANSAVLNNVYSHPQGIAPIYSLHIAMGVANGLTNVLVVGYENGMLEHIDLQKDFKQLGYVVPSFAHSQEVLQIVGVSSDLYITCSMDGLVNVYNMNS
eukprot:g2101.t1